MTWDHVLDVELLWPGCLGLGGHWNRDVGQGDLSSAGALVAVLRGKRGSQSEEIHACHHLQVSGPSIHARLEAPVRRGLASNGVRVSLSPCWDVVRCPGLRNCLAHCNADHEKWTPDRLIRVALTLKTRRKAFCGKDVSARHGMAVIGLQSVMRCSM